MKDIIFDDFQDSVNGSLLRHKSILDTLSKYTESNARVNRAVIKAVTTCGCMKINASKQCLPTDEDSFENLTDCFKNHIEGELCFIALALASPIPSTLSKSSISASMILLKLSN